MSMILAMGVFSLAMSISPGPVNFITLANGMNYGFRGALPFVSGATLGFTLLLTVIGLGVGRLLTQNPTAFMMMGYMGTAYICFMGYKVATAKVTTGNHTQPSASFLDGVLLQWLNPKAWTACIAGIAAFKLNDHTSLLWQFVGIYFIVCYVGIATWAYIGSHTKALFKNPLHLKRLNVVLGGGLILLAMYLLIIQSNTLVTIDSNAVGVTG